MKKHIEVSYTYKGNSSDLNILLRNNFLYLQRVISNITSSSSNSTYKINLTCSNQIVSMDAKFKNGHLEQYSLNKINLTVKKINIIRVIMTFLINLKMRGLKN